MQVEKHLEFAFVCLTRLGTRAHAYLLTIIHTMGKKRSPICPALVQCISSLYEWLIKEETVVFSGNGWGG